VTALLPSVTSFPRRHEDARSEPDGATFFETGILQVERVAELPSRKRATFLFWLLVLPILLLRSIPSLLRRSRATARAVTPNHTLSGGLAARFINAARWRQSREMQVLSYAP